MDFFESWICKSRRECKKCRLSREYRIDVIKKFDNPEEIDFECPLGKSADDYATTSKMAFGVAQAAGRTVKAIATGKNAVVNDEEKRRRLSICGECEFYKSGKCEACGCFVNFKARLATEHCIKGKW